MPLPSVSSTLSLFITIVLLGAPFPSCLTTEMHESKASRNYRNIDSISIICSSEDKTWPLLSGKNLSQSGFITLKMGKSFLWKKPAGSSVSPVTLQCSPHPLQERKNTTPHPTSPYPTPLPNPKKNLNPS